MIDKLFVGILAIAVCLLVPTGIVILFVLHPAIPAVFFGVLAAYIVGDYILE